MFKSRTYVTVDALNAKVAEIVASTDACVYCVAGPVEVLSEGFDGCNWDRSQILGKDWSGCQEAIQAAVADLREQFNLVSPLHHPVGPSPDVRDISTN